MVEMKKNIHCFMWYESTTQVEELFLPDSGKTNKLYAT